MRRTLHLLPAARALTLLRLFLGGLLLFAGARKMVVHLVGGFLPLPMVGEVWQTELPDRLTTWLAIHPQGVFAAIVRDLVLPHGSAAAGWLAWLQVVSGLLLVAGLWVRGAAVVAMVVAGMLALTAQATPGVATRDYLLWMVIALVIGLGNAGQTFGLDGWRRERKRGSEF